MTQKIIMALLALLGFSACSKEETVLRDEYGCPYVDFHVSGRVVDTESNPVQGIIVGTPMLRDMAVSDADGRFAIDQHGGDLPDMLLFTDMDGEKNGGEFSLKEVEVKERFEQTAPESGSNWYRGAYKAELGDVTLTKAGSQKTDD